MLDVHPPHHPTTTWRDFFIHIATIVIGLLIAVGLEQSIEALHRHHERIETEDRILKDAERNEKLVETELLWNYTTRDAARAYVVSLRQAPTVNGSVHWTFPDVHQPDDVFPTKPSMEAWEAAKEDSTVSLLPHDRVVAYGRVYLELQQEFPAYAALNLNHDALSVFTERLNDPDPFTPGKVLVLSPSDRDRMVDIMSTEAAVMSREMERWVTFRAANKAILNGCTSLDQVIDTMNHAAPYEPPKEFAPKK
jgi:hypothetical protein